MKTWKVFCLGLAVLGGLTPGLWAQAAVPAAPAAPAPPTTLLTLLGLSPDQLAACKAKFCASCLGQMVNGASKQLNFFSGCLIPQCCPTVPSASDLQKPGVLGACAQIQKDTAECGQRIKCIDYLATVDCHWWPEAEGSLAGALRTDRCECVRWAAAKALANGCCCTKKTIAALALTVSGSSADGNPSENSPRVRDAAEVALQHCLSCYSEVVPAPAVTPTPVKPPERPEGVPAPRPKPEGVSSISNGLGGSAQTVAYYERVQALPLADVVADARRVLIRARDNSPGMASIPTGHQSLFQIVSNATFMGGSEMTVSQEERTMPVVQEGRPVEIKSMESEPGRVMPVGAPPRMMPVGTEQHSSAAAPVSAYRTVSWSTPAPAAPRTPAVTMTTVKAPAVPVTVHAVGFDLNQTLNTLRTSSSPAEREQAAVGLTAVSWKVHPEIVQALLTAVCMDQTPSVRARCVACLVQMNANTPEVIITLGVLQHDSDPVVQQAVQQALVQFHATRSAAAN